MLTIVLIAAATFIATMIGGLLALKLKDKLHLILGFSAGAVIAVALFDLLPEAIDLGKGYYEISTITSIVAAGFLVYLILDRAIFLHTHEELHEAHSHGSESLSSVTSNDDKVQYRGVLGAGTLSVHSFFDGVAIGLAFQVGTTVGAIVAVAVLIHDFSDGVNTVSFILKNDGDRKKAFRWLFVDALAPVVGVFATLFFTLPENILALVLSAFAGFFLYISASDLIPESHHAHPKFLTTFMTLLGAVVLYVAIRIVSL